MWWHNADRQRKRQKIAATRDALRAANQLRTFRHTCIMEKDPCRGVVYLTVLSDNPHLVSLLFAVMLSLHCVTFWIVVKYTMTHCSVMWACTVISCGYMQCSCASTWYMYVLTRNLPSYPTINILPFDHLFVVWHFILTVSSALSSFKTLLTNKLRQLTLQTINPVAWQMMCKLHGPVS